MADTGRRSRRKQRISLITNIIFCLITLSALTGCIVLVLQNYGLKNKAQEAMSQLSAYEERGAKYIYTQTDVDSFVSEASKTANEEGKREILNEVKSQMSSGSSASELLRGLFPEDVVVYADGQYSFFPISETLKKHDYVYDNFILKDDQEVVYVDDTDQVLSRKGIDVSKHQGRINWKKVASDGVEYAFIRAGYRGSSEGTLVEDETFQANIKGAAENGIDVGIYFYTQAMTEAEAVEEAQFVLELIKDYEVQYPVVLDLEEVESDTARTASMTREEYTRAALAFLDTIKNAGYTPMIYGNLKTFMIMLDLKELEEYDKWFAYYNEPVYFPYEFTIWQYTSKGKVNGIDGNVDLNVGMKVYGE